MAMEKYLIKNSLNIQKKEKVMDMEKYLIKNSLNIQRKMEKGMDMVKYLIKISQNIPKLKRVEKMEMNIFQILKKFYIQIIIVLFVITIFQHKIMM
jgi:hypothetical protein